MHAGKSLVGAAALLAVALAGCSGDSAGGFTIKAPSSPGGVYTFTAAGGGDNYTWDLGDHLTVLHGKKVTHTYDFENGEIGVILKVKNGEKTTPFRKDIVLGSGHNDKPTFFLDGGSNWTVANETVRFSAAQSFDPDGDTLRYTWSCIRVGDAKRATFHIHEQIGVPYGTPPAGTVTARTANYTLPAPDRVVPGDMCEAFGSGSRPGTAATVEGKFTKTGVYDIYLLASDPVHPTTSGKFRILVGEPADRPAAHFVRYFNGTFQGGSDGTAQEAGELANQEGTFDRAVYTFSLPLNTLGGWVIMDFDTGALQDPLDNRVTFAVTRSSAAITTGSTDLENVTVAATKFSYGSYTLTVTLDQGYDTDYSIQVHALLNMNPFQVYQEY